MSGIGKFSKVRKRRARCKQVLVILNNRIETVDLIREEIHPSIGDLGAESLELAVLRWHGLEVRVALECVMFLSKLPPEPRRIQEARAKVDKELVSTFHLKVKREIRANRDEDRAAKRVARKHNRQTRQD
jgi:hypothetical protein